MDEWWLSKNKMNVGKEVADAIVSGSPERLLYLLEQTERKQDVVGVMLNHDDGSMNVWDESSRRTDDGDEVADIPEEWQIAFFCRGPTRFTWPLHVAIVALYHAIKKDGYARHLVPQALKVIQILIDNGANVDLGSGNILLTNVQGYYYKVFEEEPPHNQAVHLALFLKNFPWSSNQNETAQYLDKAISMLQKAKEKKEAQKKPVSLQTTAILTSVVSGYKKMLFSEDFSDITFECSDGVSIPAHKCILAMSSAYFKGALQGDWAESSDGIWKTSHSSELLKPILTVLYTGSVEDCKKMINDHKSDPLKLFEVSCEYDIETLVSISVDNCIQTLTCDSVSEMLKKADLHSNGKLKSACFEFVKSHSTQVLVRPDVMQIATDSPELWKELSEYLNKTSKKRARNC